MDGALPGSASGKPLGLGLTKAALRLIGGPDLADAIADLTGISHQKIGTLARTAAQQLETQSPGEFPEHTDAQQPAVELLVAAFKRAATSQRAIPVAALRGATDLVKLIEDPHTTAELAAWSDNERNYFYGLARVVADLTCRWYLEDQNARGLATAAGVGQALHDHRQQTEALDQIKASIADLHEHASIALDVVAAAAEATRRGVVVGPVIGQWDPADLGVHPSITVHDETTLTPYIPRPHDQQLRDALQILTAPTPATLLVLTVGTSCVGKTRTLYEAVRAVLPEWQLVAPIDDTDLAQTLLGGVPARTVVWLDELQNKLTKRADGVTAARGIAALVGAAEGGPVLFAGTIWPNELQNLTRRSTPDQAAAGTAAVPQLLASATTIAVPTTFADPELSGVPDDPRLMLAIKTATHTQPVGRKLAQVLAGGPQLIHRLSCEPSSQGAFPPAARAVIHAAGDLRRVGMPNPLPRWALEGAAPGYLDEEPPPGSTWFQTSLDQLTASADLDNFLTGTHTLDIHTDGVPALTPTWHTNPDGTRCEGYNLHDYVFAEHCLPHLRNRALTSHLWTALHDHREALPLEMRSIADLPAYLTEAAERLGTRRGVGLYTDLLAATGSTQRLAELAIAGNELARLRLGMPPLDRPVPAPGTLVLIEDNPDTRHGTTLWLPSELDGHRL
ncbi:MAG: hypothetical protein ACRCYU_18275, partial [Nocardioides sp.]